MAIDGSAAIVTDSDWVATGRSASVDTRVKVEVPPVVGVPVTSPVAGSRRQPGRQRAAVTDQV